VYSTAPRREPQALELDSGQDGHHGGLEDPADRPGSSLTKQSLRESFDTAAWRSAVVLAFGDDRVDRSVLCRELLIITDLVLLLQQ
jgi:hypothetical protein